MHDAPCEVAVHAGINPVIEALVHAFDIFLRHICRQVFALISQFFADALVMTGQLIGQVLNFLPAESLGLLAIKGEGTERIQVDTIEYRLEHTLRTVICLHRVGEYQFAPRFEHAVDFVEYPCPLA